MSFAVIFSAKEARADMPGKPIATSAGQRMVVTRDPEGWVEATSSRLEGNVLPADTKIWRTAAAARRFMRRWIGHPWYAQPDTYEVVEVCRKTVSRRETVGFERVLR